MEYYYTIKSPVGLLQLKSDEKSLLEVEFAAKEKVKKVPSSKPNPVLNKTIEQLNEYFAGKRTKFDLPIDIDKLTGSSLQKKIWKKLATIKFGKTCSYKDLGQMLDPKTGPRVIGNAMGKNPIAIILPCHRVIGSDSKLHGFGGGLNNKEYLLKLEQAEFKN